NVVKRKRTRHVGPASQLVIILQEHRYPKPACIEKLRIDRFPRRRMQLLQGLQRSRQISEHSIENRPRALSAVHHPRPICQHQRSASYVTAPILVTMRITCKGHSSICCVAVDDVPERGRPAVSRFVTPEEVDQFQKFGWVKLTSFVDPIVICSMLD